MTSEFDQLSEKIRLLAELTQKLRLENANLRLQAAALTAENMQLGERMREAKKRISALIDAIPLVVQNSEVGQ